MAMCAWTEKQTSLSKQRAQAENQRRLMLGIFTAGKVWSIDEIAFQTKLSREVVKKRANDCPWFGPSSIPGRLRGWYKLTAAGVGAKRRGLHLERVIAKLPREPNPNWHQPDYHCEYIPNEEQIAAAIAEVQATWDDEERWKRRTSLAEPLGSLE